MKETKVRQSRRATGVDLSQVATQTAKTPQNPETAASLTEMLVNSTLMQLEDAYEVNDRNPISYFNFVLDPQSFTKSVENMFHFSFLVKEGMLKIFCQIKFYFQSCLCLSYTKFRSYSIFQARHRFVSMMMGEGKCFSLRFLTVWVSANSKPIIRSVQTVVEFHVVAG